MVDKTEMASAFADGEISQNEADHLLTELYSDSELRERWHRYHLIGDALRKDLPTFMEADLSSRISKSLEQEATILAPKHSTADRIKPVYKKYKTSLAVAASVSVVGFLSFFSMNTQPQNQPQIAALQAPININLASSQSEHQSEQLRTSSHVVLTADTNQALVVDRIEPNNPKLKSYILEHEYSTASAVRRGLPPGVRMVTFTNGR